MSIASVAAQQAAASQGSASTPPSDQSALSANENTFLKLLTTQLQNQDPTSPLDTSQFTSQLVQYSSVEQQIKTNSSLTNLIQLTQGNEVVQSSSLLGRKVEVSSDHLSLQGGHAELKFTSPSAGPVDVVITNAAGNQVGAATVNAHAGANDWTWDGTGPSGRQPDGSYKVVVSRNNADGTATALPATVVGTATRVTADGTAVSVQLGALSVDFANLRSVDP